MVGEGKKREIFGPPPFGHPPFGAPPLRGLGSHPSGPHPSGPHPSGPHPSGPTFSRFGLPPFGAPPFGAPPYGAHLLLGLGSHPLETHPSGPTLRAPHFFLGCPSLFRPHTIGTPTNPITHPTQVNDHPRQHTHTHAFSHLNFGMPCLCLAPMYTHKPQLWNASVSVWLQCPQFWRSLPLTLPDWLSRKHTVSRPWPKLLVRPQQLLQKVDPPWPCQPLEGSSWEPQFCWPRWRKTRANCPC